MGLPQLVGSSTVPSLILLWKKLLKVNKNRPSLSQDGKPGWEARMGSQDGKPGWVFLSSVVFLGSGCSTVVEHTPAEQNS